MLEEIQQTRERCTFVSVHVDTGLNNQGVEGKVTMIPQS